MGVTDSSDFLTLIDPPLFNTLFKLILKIAILKS